MSKIVLNDVTNLNSLSVINDNFDKIEQEFQNKVFYRDNPDGEPNTLNGDLDANGGNIYNVATLSVSDTFTVNGQSIEQAVSAAAAEIEQSAQSAENSAIAAANSAVAAAASATTANNAIASTAANAAIATTKASEASTSASNAAASVASAVSIYGSITAVQTAASNAQASATAAATSATNSQNSATASQGYANNSQASATAASASATSAAGSATAAQGYLAPVTSTSTSSVLIATGTRNFTVETGKPWVAGMPIKIAVTASPNSNYMIGSVTSYNSGTGALSVFIDSVVGSGTYDAWTLSLQSGSSASLTTKLLRARYLASGTTYTPPADVKEFYVQVYGASGGVSGGSLGGVGGPGYAEKYYPIPSGSYSYTVGAAGTPSGTAGGTTTFNGISVTGSGGVTTTTGSAGGVGSGGDFNATGGTGGNRVTSGYGGCGGAGSRAGNGGNGGIDGGASGQGGTGGNNASGFIPGSGATAPSGSAIVMPWGTETFMGGSPLGASAKGACGAPLLENSYASLIGYPALVTYQLPMVAPVYNSATVFRPYPFAQYGNNSTSGMPGLIVIIEVLK